MEGGGRIKRNQFLIVLVILLTGLGFVTLYSASYSFAARFKKDGLYFINRQSLVGLVGILLFILTANIKLERIQGIIKYLVMGTIVLCTLTFVPGLGMTANGASRWITLGPLTYQPSEMVKVVLPLYLAHIFAKKEDSLDNFPRSILPPVLITAIFFVLIYLQNNFSTAVFIAVNALLIFFFAGVKLSFFFAAVAMLVPLSVLLVLTEEHRFRRLLSFLRPNWEPQGAGYQVHASILSISYGGLWGSGLGRGTRKLASVPEIHSDFIFSSFAEETGFFGVLVFFIVFGAFAVQGYQAGLRAEKSFPRLLGLGLVTIIVSQTLLNIAVTAGVMPATGIPLPFFSAGGSSLATTLAASGFIVNIARREAIPWTFRGRGV